MVLESMLKNDRPGSFLPILSTQFVLANNRLFPLPADIFCTVLLIYVKAYSYRYTHRYCAIFFLMDLTKHHKSLLTGRSHYP